MVADALVHPEESEIDSPTPAIERFVAMLYVRARALFDATSMLVEHQHADAAFIVARSLFETSLLLGEAEDSGKRAGHVLRWYGDAVTAEEKFLRARVAASEDVNLEASLAALKTRRTELHELQREARVSKLPPALNEEAAAKRLGRQEDIPNYIAASGFAHGAAGSILHRRRYDEDRLHIYRLQGDPDVLEPIANFAARSILLAYRSTCAILGWREDDRVDQLLEDVEFAS